MLKYCGESKKKGSHANCLLSKWCSKVCVSALYFSVTHYTHCEQKATAFNGFTRFWKDMKCVPGIFIQFSESDQLWQQGSLLKLWNANMAISLWFTTARAIYYISVYPVQ